VNVPSRAQEMLNDGIQKQKAINIGLKEAKLALIVNV
jgi:hypothetical protein